MTYRLLFSFFLVCFLVLACSSGYDNKNNRQVFEGEYHFPLTEEYRISKYNQENGLLDFTISCKNETSQNKLIQHLRSHFSNAEIKDSASNQFTIQIDNSKKWVTIIVTSTANDVIISKTEESLSFD